MHFLRTHSLTVARWTLVAVLSLGASWMIVQQGDFQQRVQRQQAISQQNARQANQQVEQMVFAGLKEAHLLIGNEKLESINAVRERIDPLESSGAFYEFRKMLEQLAGIAILPMILIAVVMALFKQKTLVKVGIKFFTILFMLWAYPYWDVLLFQAVGKPMAEQILSRERMRDMATAMNQDEAVMDEDNPLDALGRQSAAAEMCVSRMANGTDVDDLPDICFDDVVEQQIIGIMRRSATDEQVQAFIEANEENLWEQGLRWLGDRAEDVGGMVNFVANAGDWLTEQIFGVFTLIIEILWTAFLWFLLLGLEFARALSLTFAPIAIVWGMWPGQGQGLDTGSAKGWFKGHAFISFLAPGIAFLALLFWGFSLAVFGLEIEFSSIGSFATSVTVKIALLAILIFFAFNMGKFIRLLSGDVTSVAMEVGDKVRNSAINTAKAPLKGGAMAVGGAIGGPAGAQIGGKIADTASKPLDMMGDATNSLSQRFQGGMGREKPEDIEQGGFGIAKGARQKAATEAFTTFLAGKGDLPAGELTGEVAQSATRGAFDDTREEIHQFEDEVSERRRELNAPSQSQRQALAEGLRDIQRTREEQQDVREQLGIPEPERREGEVLDIDPRDIAEGLRRAQVSEMGVELGAQGAQQLVLDEGTSVELNAERLDSGEVNFQLNDEAMEGMHGLLADNVDLREAMFEEGARAFGKRENVPTVIKDGVEVPNVGQMVNQSDDVAHAVRELAQVSQRAQNDLHQRELISHEARQSGIEKDSAMERALRMMDDEIISVRGTMDDKDYNEFLQNQGARTLRLSRTAEQQDGQVSSDQIQHIFTTDGTQNARMGVREHGLDASGSADEVSMTALKQAIEKQNQHLQQMRQRQVVRGGQKFGLDYSAYIKGGDLKFQGQPGSIFEDIKNDNPDLDPEKMYEKAVQQALDQADLSADELSEQEINERVFLTTS